MSRFRYTPLGTWLRTTPNTTTRDRALVILGLVLLAVAISLVITVAILFSQYSLQPFGPNALL